MVHSEHSLLKCGTFSTYPPDYEQQIFARGGTTLGTSIPEEHPRKFGWQ